MKKHTHTQTNKHIQTPTLPNKQTARTHSDLKTIFSLLTRVLCVSKESAKRSCISTGLLQHRRQSGLLLVGAHRRQSGPETMGEERNLLRRAREENEGIRGERNEENEDMRGEKG